MDATTFKPKKPFDVNEMEDKITEEVKEIFNPKPKTKPIGPTTQLLEDRGTTHGSFEDNARISQGLKEWMRGNHGWSKLTDVEREAMDMIALKFSRVLSGKSLEKQHWEDIVGYAQLALNKCA
jgi:hypothetical protein